MSCMRVELNPEHVEMYRNGASSRAVARAVGCCKATVLTRLKELGIARSLSESVSGRLHPNYGKRRSEETRRKMSIARTGWVPSKEWRRKMSLVHIGKKRSLETRAKMSLAHKGHEVSDETRRKIGLAHMGNKHNLGKKRTMETRRKQSESQRGEKGHNWQGGLVADSRAFRDTFEYRIWRKSVFERDYYTCQECGARGGNGRNVILHADHIKPFALYNGKNGYPDLRLEVDNGRTLCKECHRATPTYGNGTLSMIASALEVA